MKKKQTERIQEATDIKRQAIKKLSKYNYPLSYQY